MSEPAKSGIRIRRNATRRYEVGTVFRELDGLFVVVRRDDRGRQGLGLPAYDYHLRRMLPDEEVVWDVMAS